MNDTKQYHFSGSRVNTSLDEPLYMSKFACNFVLPSVLAEKYGSSELLLEQMLKIDGLDLDKMPGTVSQKYRYNDRTFLGTIVDTKVTLSFDFEVNVNPDTLVPYPYDLLRDWCRLCYDPNTGLMTLKKDYVGSATIDVTNKIGQLIKHVDVPIIFPISQLPPWNLNFTSEAIYKITGFRMQAEGTKDLLAGG